ncbi:MAG: hypothetical protein ABIQ10_08535 [Gemmatimonadaceae bacterium]
MPVRDKTTETTEQALHQFLLGVARMQAGSKFWRPLDRSERRDYDAFIEEWLPACRRALGIGEYGSVAIALRIESPLTPEVILEAIRDDGREWRESVIPADLRKNGVLKVDVRIRGSDVRMRYEWGIGAPSFDTLELRGTVSTGANGGSLVLARSGRNSGLAGSIATLLVISVLLWFRESKGWGAPLFLALVIGIVRFISDSEVTRQKDPAARYLAERLEGAVTSANTAALPAS